MSCFDFIQNNDETDVDCGGTHCWQRCAPGDACDDDTDCMTSLCEQMRCQYGERTLYVGSGPAPPVPEESVNVLTVFVMVLILVAACIIINGCVKFLYGYEEVPEPADDDDVEMPLRENEVIVDDDI